MNLPTEIRYRPYDEWTEEDKENIVKNVSKSLESNLSLRS